MSTPPDPNEAARAALFTTVTDERRRMLAAHLPTSTNPKDLHEFVSGRGTKVLVQRRQAQNAGARGSDLYEFVATGDAAGFELVEASELQPGQDHQTPSDFVTAAWNHTLGLRGEAHSWLASADGQQAAIAGVLPGLLGGWLSPEAVAELTNHLSTVTDENQLAQKAVVFSTSPGPNGNLVRTARVQTWSPTEPYPQQAPGTVVVNGTALRELVMRRAEISARYGSELDADVVSRMAPASWE
ncbi:MAG TPA: hypothetical protein VMS55_03050 [Myxococcota bacterium]|nr:hypothetical protein [Myxococcota bacterium]